MAAKVRYLLYRQGRYYARLVIPKELRPFLEGKSELRTPLGADRRRAIATLPSAVAALQHKIGIAEQEAARQNHAVTVGRYPLSIPQIAQLDYQRQVEFDSELRQHDHRYADMGVDIDRANRLRDGFSGKLSDADLAALVGDRLEHYKRAGSLDAAPGSAEWRAAAQALCIASYEALARESERNEGDFGGAPTHPILVQEMPEPETIITFDQIIDAEVKRRARGKDAKPLPERTQKIFRQAAAAFAANRGSENAATVTTREGEEWCEAMLNAGELANRTIKQNLQNVTTVLNWGRRHFRETLGARANPMGEVTRPEYKSAPSYLSTYTESEAKLVLRAARNEAEVHLRWIPWLCAYSGMRVNEAGGLRKEDFFKHGGRWFYRVTSLGGRGLKNEGSERRIPVHNALIDEGLIEFIEGAPAGWLFVGKLGKKIDVQPRLSEWVRGMIPYEARPDVKPNHGWRHYFEDLCRLHLVPDDARKYITGRNTGSSADMYGKSDLMLGGLAKAMDMIQPVDLGEQQNG